jgi:HSP20 family protein
MVTIKGSRAEQTEESGKKYYYQECYWGSFSRQIILPEEVDSGKAEAAMKDGILTLRIPKIHKVQKKKVTVQSV